MVCQLVVEGTGHIDEADLQKAIKKVAITNPAIRVRIRGFWGIRYWTANGPLPRISTIEYEWDGQYRPGLSFIDQPLDLIHGPVAEIVQIKGQKTYLVFRIHHAVTDGVGLVDYVQSILLALNQKEPECFHSKITLEQLPPGNLKAIPPAVRNAAIPYPLDNNNHQEFDRSRVWRRICLQGKDQKVLLKTILVIATLARGNSEETIRLHVPASLRRHVPEEKTSANLIGMVRLDVEKDESTRTLVKKFNQRLDEKQELPIAVNSLTSKVTHWIPLRLLRFLEEKAMGKLLAQPHFRCSGTASSLGKVSLQECSTKTFQAQGAYGIPVPPLGSPLMAVLLSNESGTEIIISANRTLISDSSMDDLAERFEHLMSEAK